MTSIREGALLVPQRAVTELQGSYQVAVVDGDNKVSIRPVKVGDRVGSMWIIEEGLQSGRKSGRRRHTKSQTGHGGQPEAVCRAFTSASAIGEELIHDVQLFHQPRPIVAMVIAILTVVVGLIAMRGLPLAQFPEIVPPQIIVFHDLHRSGRRHHRAVGRHADSSSR